MKYARYFIGGFLVFMIVLFLSINIAQLIGPGPGDIGMVVTAIAMLCAIIVICTFIIVDSIKNKN